VFGSERFVSGVGCESGQLLFLCFMQKRRGCAILRIDASDCATERVAMAVKMFCAKGIFWLIELSTAKIRVHCD
jgi:hypothetical protein